MMQSTLPIRTTYSFDSRRGQPEQIVLMFRGGRSRDWNYCLALTHDLKTGNTCAIVHGLERHEIDLLIHCLKSSRDHVDKPMLLPLFLTELKVHFFAVLLEERAVRLEDIEYETGMSHGFSEDPKRNPALSETRKQDLAKLDFGPITQKLTSLTGTLAFCDLTFKGCRQDLDLIVATSCEIGSPSRTSRRHSVVDETRPDPDQRSKYLQGLLDGAQAHQIVLHERTKAQIDTVYSMIGQRDNRLNIETATAARRDSNDMRVIAAVTLIFLPGTFTATLFSTTFFNFQNRGSKIVSWWLWLYFVVTVLLSTVVIVGWIFISKKQGRTLAQSLNMGLEKGGRAVQRDEESAITSEKRSLRHPTNTSPNSTHAARRTTSIGRIAEVGLYTKNDLPTRLWMSGISTELQTHY